jgi:DNA-directed RNA polymerase specialized sigma subunit
MKMELDMKIQKAMNDTDIVSIMHKASAKFERNLDEDEIYTCHLNALWKCFLTFDKNKNTKFTTYLYRGVFMECVKQLKFKNKSKLCVTLHDNISGKDYSTIMCDIFDELENEEEKTVLRDRMANCTLNEIAKKQQYSRETARKRLKKIYKNLKNKFQ